MQRFSDTDITIGAYEGRVDAHLGPAQLDWLAGLGARLRQGEGEVLAAGRNLNVRLAMPPGEGGTPVSVVVKSFGVPGHYQAWRARQIGSKARRTWVAARHLVAAGVGTPPPLAFLERWQGGRPVESFMVTVFQEGVTSLAAALNQLYRHEPESEKLMALLEAVAGAVRNMHASGFVHYDLGNQNILLRRTGETGWGDVQFIDLNRGRIQPELGERERARDLSRITLPSDFLRVFKEMYYGGEVVPPEAFQTWERRYRQRFARHVRSRRWRHPIRQARCQVAPGNAHDYPAPKDLWIWDERSGQPLVTMVSRDRARHYSLARTLQTLSSALRWLPRVLSLYRHRRSGVYGQRVSMRDRIGVALEVQPEGMERKLALLERLGPLPVIVRFYHHRGPEALEAGVSVVDTLCDRGHPVSITLVQDRQAVRDPQAWQGFVDAVLDRVAERVELVTAGHAINRVKWGVWDYTEYRRLMAPFATWKKRCPGLLIGGPSMIDFEYAYIPAALDRLPDGLKLDVLTHLLYVDRRGAPETPQGQFAALEKFTLARAVAGAHRRCGDRLVVTEFNWPLKGTGVYSPVGAPYVSPGVRTGDPSVSETEAAAYLLRYVLIAICSGQVERVFWWRLVARGYGLVDDSEPAAWRERPGFRVLAVLLDRLRDSDFTGHRVLAGEDEGSVAEVFAFETASGDAWWMAYTTAARCRVRFPESPVHLTDAFGEAGAVYADGELLELGGMPAYLEPATLTPKA